MLFAACCNSARHGFFIIIREKNLSLGMHQRAPIVMGMGKKGGAVPFVKERKEMIGVFLLPEQASRGCLVAHEVCARVCS